MTKICLNSEDIREKSKILNITPHLSLQRLQLSHGILQGDLLRETTHRCIYPYFAGQAADKKLHRWSYIQGATYGKINTGS